MAWWAVFALEHALESSSSQKGPLRGPSSDEKSSGPISFLFRAKGPKPIFSQRPKTYFLAGRLDCNPSRGNTKPRMAGLELSYQGSAIDLLRRSYHSQLTCYTLGQLIMDWWAGPRIKLRYSCGCSSWIWRYSLKPLQLQNWAVFEFIRKLFRCQWVKTLHTNDRFLSKFRRNLAIGVLTEINPCPKYLVDFFINPDVSGF